MNTVELELILIHKHYFYSVIADAGAQDLLWIGLSDEAREGDFLWSDGTSAGHTAWSGDNPDNYGAGQHCVVTNWQSLAQVCL